MAFLYLVAFKGQPYGHEDDVNYALRELLEEHCSYCNPAGRTEVFGPYTPKQSLAESVDYCRRLDTRNVNIMT